MQYAIWMRIYRLFPISYCGCTKKQSLFKTKEGVFSSEPEKYSVKIIVHCFVYYVYNKQRQFVSAFSVKIWALYSIIPFR